MQNDCTNQWLAWIYPGLPGEAASLHSALASARITAHVDRPYLSREKYQEALNKSILDFSRPLVLDAALPPTSLQACIHAGESAQVVVRTQLASKSVTDVTARLLGLGRHISVSQETLS